MVSGPPLVASSSSLRRKDFSPQPTLYSTNANINSIRIDSTLANSSTNHNQSREDHQTIHTHYPLTYPTSPSSSIFESDSIDPTPGSYFSLPPAPNYYRRGTAQTHHGAPGTIIHTHYAPSHCDTPLLRILLPLFKYKYDGWREWFTNLSQREASQEQRHNQCNQFQARK